MRFRIAQHFTAMLVVLFAFSARAADPAVEILKSEIIVDVRTPQEFAAGHIGGAINIPLDQIAREISTVTGLKKDSPVIVYCRTGHRSAIARTILEQQGFTRVQDGGGMEGLARRLGKCGDGTC